MNQKTKSGPQVHNELIADLRARQQQHIQNKTVKMETVQTFCEKIFLLKCINAAHSMPSDIYCQAILPVFVRLFASLATLEFCTCTLGQPIVDLQNPDPHRNQRLEYTVGETGWKKWQVRSDSYGSYELVQCKTRILPGRQLWVVECSKGDKWVGIATRQHGYDDGYGCWPETAFTQGHNSYIQSISHRLRLLIFITIHLEGGTIDWELYDYSTLPEDEVPSPALWLRREQSLDVPRLETYRHQLPSYSPSNEELYFSFNTHNPNEYVRLLDYSLSELKS